MKGAVFSGFAEFIEQEYGLAVWQETIEQSQLESNGEYLATELYEDDEFNQLMSTLERITGQNNPEIQRKFGVFFFPTLFSLVQQQVKHIDNLFDFLRAVDEVIHVEVKKADPMAYTPTLLYDQPQPTTLVIRYVSRRKMCFFAEGLILGAAKHFNQTVAISQTECVCQGDEHCLIRVTS
ncbi:heme NO-binding domain-containing protein [Endozoicomonas sp. G2_1]|uniref:heme NO-binding domain-containing protein n=1 Tax=Endozoicomonas sp. G2_1 TaxID=2821091 RepID=UPI001AD9A7D8|nr:heme NO-binding domain-containing protein [Endozoicomonas sp. G2_1]MBO9490182.1 heme NO-binding domain-containing protein [Endozoicomonas sp. G2_1]